MCLNGFTRRDKSHTRTQEGTGTGAFHREKNTGRTRTEYMGEIDGKGRDDVHIYFEKSIKFIQKLFHILFIHCVYNKIIKP